MQYICNYCNKNYSSYQSLWIHNKKFHNPNQTESNISQYNCKYCCNKYSNRQNKWKHEQICKEKNIQLCNIKEETKLEKIKLKVVKEKF